MNPISIIILALACSTSATIYLSTTTTALTAAQSAALLGGIGLVKVAALGAVALVAASRSRGKREAISTNLDKENEVLLSVVGFHEPEQCIRRLICDLATNQLPETEENVILRLFPENEEVAPTSAKFEFSRAAKLGRVAGDIKQCEISYRCPATGAEIEALIAQN
jgi:hypothetical protein